MLRQMQLRLSGHLVRMDDERLPKRLFYGDVATGSRRQEGQIRRYKDTLKSALKRLQISPTNWEDLAHNRPTWRKTVKMSAAIYAANRIAAAKVKCDACKLQLRPLRNAEAQPLPTCPRGQRTFRARIGLTRHLRINCASRTTPTVVCPSLRPPLPRPLLHRLTLTAPPHSSSFSSTAPTTAALAAVTHIHNPDTPTDITRRTSDSRDPSWLSINDSEEIIKTKQTEVASSELLTAIRQPWLFRQPAEADQHPVESGEYERVRLHQTGVDRPRSAACSATAPPPVDSAVVIVALPREVAVMPHLQAETTCQDAEGSRDCPGAVST
nr:unnamed protein product [Spirometra erinaceieuropaei]